MKNRDQTYCLTLDRVKESNQRSTSSAVYETHEITMRVRCKEIKEMHNNEKKRNELNDFVIRIEI